jgi:nucleoside-diphosphate-sugar epimerase
VAGARPAVVFHLAGDTAVRRLAGDLAQLDRSVAANLTGTLNMLRAAHEAGPAPARVVRAGGLEEYGNGPAPYREDQRERPVSPYSAGQVAATHYAQMLGATVGLPVVTLRLALTYGPAQSAEFLVPTLIRQCLAGRDFDMTSGEQGRDYLYVADAVEALVRATAAPAAVGEVINVGSGVEVPVRAVAEAIVRLTGAGIRLRVGAVCRRDSEIEHLVCDPAKARRLLGWEAVTDLGDGLTRTIAWYRGRGQLPAATGPDERTIRETDRETTPLRRLLPLGQPVESGDELG